MNRGLVSILAVVMGVGCTLPDDPEPELDEVEQAATSNCPAWMCGQNSPVMMNRGFWELDLDHRPNEQLFTYERFTKDGLEYKLHVTDGIITATRPGITLAGHRLVGGELWVQYDGGPEYVIRIMEVGLTTFWASPHTRVQSYSLMWAPTDDGLISGDFADLCSNPDGRDTLGMNAYQTLVFEGDRYDAETKTIVGYDERWFNLGCAGSTLAKMHLTGHTAAAADAGFTTTVEERQTMLKMLSADYCGDGTAFTVAGQPLEWADDEGWMGVSTDTTLEARWNARGATCLMKPRVTANPTQLSRDTFGDDIEAQIAAHCERPPQCADETTNPKPEHLISAHPW